MSTIITDNPYTFTVADNMSINARFIGNNQYVIGWNQVEGATYSFQRGTDGSSYTTVSVSPYSSYTYYNNDSTNYLYIRKFSARPEVDDYTIADIDFSNASFNYTKELEIPAHAFERCVGLKKFSTPRISGNRTHIGNQSFRDSGIEEADLYYFGTNNAPFYYCPELKYVKFGGNSSIANGFCPCSPKLETLYFQADFSHKNNSYSDLELVNTAAFYFFNGGTDAENEAFNLKNIIVESGNSYYESISNILLVIKSTKTATMITRSESIELPEGIIKISANCFKRNKVIESVKIPSTCDELEGQTFWNCNKLKTIYCYATTPPTLSHSNPSQVFTGTPEALVIYVPSSSVNAYKSATGWSSKASNIQALP